MTLGAPGGTLRGPTMSTFSIDDPFTGDVVHELPEPSLDELAPVLDAAREGARHAAATPLAERLAISERACADMEANADVVALDISKSMGKPFKQAKGEVAGMAARWRHMQSIAEASLADETLPAKEGFERRIARAPLGVVLDLPAWNYPLLTAVNALAPAFLAGNAVLLKHSPRTPRVGAAFARAFANAGAAKGVVQSFMTSYPVTEAVVADPRVDHVLFTGSNHGGRRIQAAASTKLMHVGLELGGNDPAYVAADADVAFTAENVVDGAMYNAGQSCCAVERVYVHASRYADFVAAARPLVESYVLGDPRVDTTTMGPIAQPWHPEELEKLVADAVARGAKLLVGGHRTQVGGKGRFFEPTMLVDVPQDARLFRQESFGPILAIARVDGDDDALARMNDATLGLTASVWTKDRGRAERLARALEFGTVYMNRCDALDPALPWTGWKESGRGSTLSRLGFDGVTKPKALHFRL